LSYGIKVRESVVINLTSFNTWKTEKGRLRKPVILGCNFVFSAGFCLWGVVEGGIKRGRKTWRMNSGRCDVMLAIIGEGELSSSGEHGKEKGGEYPR
jgi:hypothetical protein